MKFKITIGLVIAIGLWQDAPLTQATDYSNSEGELSIEAEDGYYIAYLGRELQEPLHHERTDDDKNRSILNPRSEVGFPHNSEVKVWSVDETSSGNMELKTLYGFNTEFPRLSVFALSGRPGFLTGKSSDGVVDFMRKQKLKRDENANIIELGIRYFRALNYSRTLGPDTTLVVNFMGKQKLKKGRNVVELGIRYQLTPLTVLAIGAGAGIAEESPDFSLIMAFRHSFRIF